MNAILEELRSRAVELVGSVVIALPAVIVAIAILVATRFAANFIRKFIKRNAPRLIRSQSLQSLLVQVGFAGTWIGGSIVAAIALFPDLNLGDIIGLLGLGSVAISFAFQDIFKNFLAGILILLREPFRIGDQIIVEGYEGTVVEISIRSTEIRTYQGETAILPNSLLFTNPVQVRTAGDSRRTDLAIGVDYNTPLPVAVETLLSTIRGTDGVLEMPAPEVDVVGFGDSSIDFRVRYWTDPFQVEVRRIQSRAIVALKAACDRADINIPYPIRTVYFYDQQRFDDRHGLPHGRPDLAPDDRPAS